MKWLDLLICFSVIHTMHDPLRGQEFINDAGAREKHFVYEVKQIDEFFERFNDDKNSFIRKMYKSYNIKYTIKRAELINSLFNYETNGWKKKKKDSFIACVTSKNKIQLLNFYGKDWFAEALCKFRTGSAEIEVPVILKLDADENNRSKWMIEGVRNNPFPSENNNGLRGTGDKTKFIHPASHSNNFIALGKALNDKENLSVYFDESFFKQHNAMGFYNAILQKRMNLLYVKTIKYHFLQVDGWIFTVEQFQRKALNSGWLISYLRQASDAEKEAYRKLLTGG